MVIQLRIIYLSRIIDHEIAEHLIECCSPEVPEILIQSISIDGCWCGKPMVLVDGYNNPDIAAGSRIYQCPDHPNIVERTMWYCPYVPLLRDDSEDLATAFKTMMRIYPAQDIGDI